jgi:hypothetical protein
MGAGAAFPIENAGFYFFKVQYFRNIELGQKIKVRIGKLLTASPYGQLLKLT